MNVQPNLQVDKTAFLAWVQGREENYELAEGRVVMMTGGTARTRRRQPVRAAAGTP